MPSPDRQGRSRRSRSPDNASQRRSRRHRSRSRSRSDSRHRHRSRRGDRSRSRSRSRSSRRDREKRHSSSKRHSTRRHEDKVGEHSRRRNYSRSTSSERTTAQGKSVSLCNHTSHVAPVRNFTSSQNPSGLAANSYPGIAVGGHKRKELNEMSKTSNSRGEDLATTPARSAPTVFEDHADNKRPSGSTEDEKSGSTKDLGSPTQAAASDNLFKVDNESRDDYFICIKQQQLIHKEELQQKQTSMESRIEASSQNSSHWIIEKEDSGRAVYIHRMTGFRTYEKPEEHQTSVEKLRLSLGVHNAEENIQRQIDLERAEEEEMTSRSRTFGRKDVFGYLDLENIQQASLDVAIGSGNRGFRLLKKMGWEEGAGLGKNKAGIVEPVRLRPNYDQLGIGKQTEYDTMGVEATKERKRLEVEITRTAEDIQKRKEDLERRETIKEEVRDMNRSFYCETCNKQYKNVGEMSNHLSSYDHHHTKRLKEMKEMEKSRRDVSGKKKRAERREAKELERQIKAARAAAAANEPERQADSESANTFPPFTNLDQKLVTHSTASSLDSGSVVSALPASPWHSKPARAGFTTAKSVTSAFGIKKTKGLGKSKILKPAASAFAGALQDSDEEVDSAQAMAKMKNRGLSRSLPSS